MDGHLAPPSTMAVEAPASWLLSRHRGVGRGLLRAGWSVRVHGAESTPREGPVIFAANHLGVLDGPMLASFAPRTTHVLTKSELFAGPAGRFLTAAGQIPLDRTAIDAAAVRACVRVLRDGGCVGIFPEGHRGAGTLRRLRPGVGYLGLVTGAPVVPVTFFGTRLSGARSGSLPPVRFPIDVVFGSPIRVDPLPWPRTREQVRQTVGFIREQMLVHLEQSQALVGRTLPGPLPAGDRLTPPTRNTGAP
ncbi:lysophospholipid acyltransferase family protein [Nocardioides limicola]|uniref:lysophospholipid acyltransferase family protein n=1 Tax=Nocardioides limicola TaxID=2803368 RepID=UPI00193B9D40|nr:lysophospholipid acyltransferase family protein [Nocardioides sp. DJM-14]